MLRIRWRGETTSRISRPFSAPLHPKPKPYFFATLAQTENLPIENESRKIKNITTPIFYVNSAPHIGHLYSAVIADVLKRFYELKGFNVFLSTGTDEHGLKIQQAAEKTKKEPIDFCDEVSAGFKNLFDKANISYSSFIRTTEKSHAIAVQEFWNRLLKNGYIYKGKHEGWYSISDEAFYSNSQIREFKNEITGEKYMVAVDSGQRVEWMEEDNYKFKLSKFQDKLKNWITNNPEVVLPKSRYNELMSWIDQGLADLSVSRLGSRLKWGIPVPNDSEQIIYVWLDALTNYLTITGFPWTYPNGSCSDSIRNIWPADIHVVGKDILRFHGIYWPAFLLAAGLPLPRQILAHAHWTMGKHKMSKSLGNVVDPFEILDVYGVDSVRFYLMSEGGISDDGDFSKISLGKSYKMLSNQLGNLFSRSMTSSLNPSLMIPTPTDIYPIHSRDGTLYTKLINLPGIYNKHFEKREFGRALQVIFDAISEANTHLTENEPWRLNKDSSQAERLQKVLFYYAETMRIAAILLQPVMPSKMKTLLDDLAVNTDERCWEDTRFGVGWGGLENNNSIQKRYVRVTNAHLFPHIKD